MTGTPIIAAAILAAWVAFLMTSKIEHALAELLRNVPGFTRRGAAADRYLPDCSRGGNAHVW